MTKLATERRDALDVLWYGLDAIHPAGWGVPADFDSDGWTLERYMSAHHAAEKLLRRLEENASKTIRGGGE